MKSASKMLVALALLGAACLGSLEAADQVREFRELHTTANHLESAEGLLSSAGRQSPQALARRAELLARFAGEVKSDTCGHYFEHLVNQANKYKQKAYEYVREKGGNWFSNAIKFGGAIGAMKSMSNNDANLRKITERYESQAKSGQLTDADVNCDIAKYRIQNLNAIMFVLQTDVKQLTTESPQILNPAIYRQLAGAKFVAHNNFYETHELSRAQFALLRDYYLAHTDPSQVSVRQATPHFEDPGNLVVGRLLDSCTAVGKFADLWAQDEADRLDQCAKSQSDPENGLFLGKYTIAKYEDVVHFCASFLAGL